MTCSPVCSDKTRYINKMLEQNKALFVKTKPVSFHRTSGQFPAALSSDRTGCSWRDIETISTCICGGNTGNLKS